MDGCSPALDVEHSTLSIIRPAEVSEVLSTDFGNAIRAFEVYPYEDYGADSPVIWYRLASVMPNEFGQQIEYSRSQIDFLLNICLFSVIIALLGFVRTIYSGNWCWLLWTAGGLGASYIFYRCAVASVPQWGEWVKSAFDCYLPALAKQLGFEPPTTELERRCFWTTFSQQLIYRRRSGGEMIFRIEKWKQVSETANKELECGTESQDGKAQEPGNKNDMEDSDSAA